MKRILVTGGKGRFGKILKKLSGKNYLFPSKKQLNILSIKSTEKYIKKVRPKYLIHLAGLSRPLKLHEDKINESIKLNIIGTCNVVIVCKKYNIKLIYLSTSYVYPGIKGNYKETDPVLPMNNYAWSKLGGESAVHMYKNSLIVRACMTERPFIHKEAFTDVKLNFIFHDEIIPLLKKILDKKGIINLGGPTQTVYNFAKKYNKNIKKTTTKGLKLNFPKNSSMNLKKINKIFKKKT
jgi:dTDP-4-dehydrorhamnose reductase